MLAPVFHFNTWWLVLLYAVAMLAISSAETVSHPAASYKVSALQVTCCMHEVQYMCQEVARSGGIARKFGPLSELRRHVLMPCPGSTLWSHEMS